MRRALLILAVLLGALVIAPAAWAGEATTSDGHVVRWDPGLERAGREVVSLLPRIEAEVERKMGFPFPKGPATIVVAKGIDSMRNAARVHVPEWAAGVCIGQRSLIVLRADRMLPPSPARSITTVLRHEWVHLAWARRAGLHVRSLPRWAEEGLAEEIGGGVSVEGGATLDYAAAWGRLIPWKDLTAGFPRESPRAALAYRQGASWIRFFLKQRGWDDLRAVLADLADGKGKEPSDTSRTPLDRVLLARTERGLDLWTAEWRVSLEEEARPWFHLLGHDVGWSLIIFFSMISVVLYFAVRRRRRAAIEALPDG
ncbi:MAG: hypothetical protein QNJ98_07230 [Planctomycetota bacterium]|nr:hypothetical protein [Planctomycetota bacterium]